MPEPPTVRDELPIRLGSPLLSKLRRGYWALPDVAGRPFVIALQSFASEDALRFADSAMTDLLYGVRMTGRQRSNGTLEVTSTVIEAHVGSLRSTLPRERLGRVGERRPVSRGVAD